MLALLAWIFRLRPYLIADGQLNWLALAIIFSLIGDVMLMLPGDFFIPGLISFSLAHLAYIFGFGIALFSSNFASVGIALMVILAAYQIYKRLAEGLEQSQQTKLKLPVFTYTGIIATMVILALQTLISHGWESYRALLISAGALLFMLSDTWIAWDRFVEPIKLRDLRIMISYHLAQICLCMGFLFSL